MRSGGTAAAPLRATTVRICLAVMFLGNSLAPVAAAAVDAWQAAVGYDRLTAARGASTPIGAGVTVSTVEAGSEYMPISTYSEFVRPGGLENQINFQNGSNTNFGTSTHATFQVGQYLYGNTLGLAKGVTSVTGYQVENWYDNVLKRGFGAGFPPDVQAFKVQNHSWVHTLGGTADQSVLRRFDYMVERDDVTAVVGANNNGIGAQIPNPSLAHPSLLVQSYNSIVVGRYDGGHSRGATSGVYGASGRYRPDIVSYAPASNFTSTTTAQVSGAAAVIRGILADSDGAGPDSDYGDHSETTKAILLAGATKTEYLPGVVGSVDGPPNALGWFEPSTAGPNPVYKNWDRTATRPLDDIFGAGELNIYNSYLMTEGGRGAGGIGAPPIVAAANYGWDYQNFKGNASVGDVYYKFVVPVGSTAPELSVILSWNRTVVDYATEAAGNVTQNLDLRLYRPGENFLLEPLDSVDEAAGFARRSISTIDNVEHIYIQDLTPGTYTLKVSGAANWDYGIAWRMSTLFDEPSADFDEDGAVTGTDLLAWQRNLGKLVGASHGEGDANGDGAVDAADLQLWRDGVMPAPVFAAAVASRVPEPAAIASAVLALGFGGAALRGARRRRSV